LNFSLEIALNLVISTILNRFFFEKDQKQDFQKRVGTERGSKQLILSLVSRSSVFFLILLVCKKKILDRTQKTF
jgi:hypothetical protein